MQRADMPVDDLQQQHAEQLTAGESQHRGPGVDLGEEQLHPGRGEPAQHTGEVAGDPVAPDDRSSGGADFAAAVGRGGRICSQQLAELGRVAALGCRQEALDEPVPLGSVRLESRARGTETLAGSAMKLPGVGLRDVEKPGDLPMAVGERLPQYEKTARSVGVSRSMSRSSARDTESRCSTVPSGSSAPSAVSTGSGSQEPT